MPRSPRRPSRAPAAALALLALGLSACAGTARRAAGPPPDAPAVYRSLLGRNLGLSAVRAVVEVRIAFAGRQVSLPGVLQLDAYGGFRLELLDPLDRPLSILFVEDGRIVQYWPARRAAASLAVFPAACGSVDPADWVGAILASSLAPVAGERLADRGMWGRDRSLERRRDGELRQSLRYRVEGGEPRPRLVSWYCADETVMQLRLRDWIEGAAWRLPSRLEIDYPKAGLSVQVELREVEANPPPSGQPLRPQLDDDVRWTSWNLPR
jgi:hypothetical protein